MTPEEELAKLRAELATQKGRLDYAVLQLEREAKFLPESRLENRRFHRAYGVVREVRDALEGLT